MPSLSDLEQQAQMDLGPRLRDYINVGSKLSSMLGRLLNARGEVVGTRTPLGAFSCLLTKIANDTRCVALLAISGYHQQAATVLSSLHETVFRMAYIGNSQQRAEDWFDHQAERDSYPRGVGMQALPLDFFRATQVPDPEESTRREHEIYRRLCMFKHSNPVIQQGLGYTVRGGTAVHQNGPAVSDYGQYLGVNAVFHADRCLYFAILAYLVFQDPDGNREAVSAELRNLAAELGGLARNLEAVIPPDLLGELPERGVI